MSEHRRRVKMRMIYRQWSIYRQMRWYPPYGWVTKKQALGLSYGIATPALVDVITQVIVDPLSYLFPNRN